MRGVKYVALYETVLDAEKHNARGGRGLVVGYGLVDGLPYRETHGHYAGKYEFSLKEIRRLATPRGNLLLRNIRCTKLLNLLNAVTLKELFKGRDQLPLSRDHQRRLGHGSAPGRLSP